MTRYSAGEAAVRIVPEAKSFLVELERKLRSMRDPRFTIAVNADTDAAKRATDSFRREQESRGVDVNVDAETAGASGEMARWRATQEANAVNIKIDIDVDQAGAQLAGLSRQLETVRRSDILRLNLGAGALSAIGPATTGLANLAGALQMVAQAGLAVPGAIAGAGASIATLAVGLSGIKDAYDAVSKAAESSGTDQAAQARTAAAASNQLRNAVVDETRAREDVARATRDARRELQDLRIEQRGGMIDESRAIFEAQKAREDLMRGNYSDIRDASLRVAEADQRVIEVRNRNAQTAERLNEANARGIAGADGVRDANERLAQSQQQVADAQAAVAASATSSGAAQDKAAQAMAKLGPNAQQLVRTFVDMKPAFQDFRTAISEPLLEGKAEEIEKFFTTVRPVLQSGMAGIARGWNQNITSFLGSVGSQRGQGLIDRILGNTGDAQARLSNAIDPLVEGIGVLTAAGSDALPRLADGLASVLDRFRDFIVEADSDGRLDKWINDGIDGARMLGESVLNIGKSFTAITQAADGRGFLQWLQDATGRLQTFLNSTEGQTKLREFFEQGREIFEKWKPVLRDIPGLLKGIHDGAVTYIGGVLDVINPLTTALSEFPRLVEGVVTAFLAWKTIDGVSSLLTNLGKANTVLGATIPASAATAGGALSRAFGPVAAVIAAMEATDFGLEKFNKLFGTKIDAVPGSAMWLINGLTTGDWELPWQDANKPDGANTTAALPNPAGTAGLETLPGFRDRPAPAPSAPRGASTDDVHDQPLNPSLEDILRGHTGMPIPSRATGGPTPGPRQRGFLAELHGQEWIHDAKTVDFYGNDVMNAMWRKQIDPRALRGLVPKFWDGGPADPNDPNYVGHHTTGVPGVGTPAGPASIAPNPYTATVPGALNTITNQVLAGTQQPVALGQNLLGQFIPGMNGSPQQGGNGLLPGLWGLAQAGSDPALQQQWMQQTAGWLVNDWLGGTVIGGLMGSVLPNILNSVGLGGILNSPYVNAVGQTAGHFAGLSGLTNPNAAQGGFVTLPDGTQMPLAAFLTPGAPNTGSATATGSGGWADYMAQLKPGQTVSMESVAGWPRLYAPGKDGEAPIVPADLQSFVQQIGTGSLVANTRDTGGSLHQAGFAFDISGTPEDMQALAEYVRDNMSDRTLQLIYEGIRGNGELAAGSRVGPDYYAQSGYHGDHVHWAYAPGTFAPAIPGSAPVAGSTGVQSFLQQLYSGRTPAVGQSSAGLTGLKATAQQMYLAAGLPPSEWAAFDELITRESSWSPTAKNPSSTAFGLGQFLDTTQANYGITGSTDPTAQLQAVFAYLRDRYNGSPAEAIAFHDAHNWYDVPTGLIPRGISIAHNDSGKDEVSLRMADAVKARQIIKQAVKPQQPRVPDAQKKLAPPPPQNANIPSVLPPSTPPVGVQPPPAMQPPVAVQSPTFSPAAGAGIAPPAPTDYTVPWVNQLIDSGAAVGANIASQAIGALGGGGGIGMPGAGALGQFVGGAIMQGGKVIKDVANVVSAAMVGSVPGSFMTTPEAYGRTLRPEQEIPQTALAAERGRGGPVQYGPFFGHDTQSVMQQINVAESMHQQTSFAARRRR